MKRYLQWMAIPEINSQASSSISLPIVLTRTVSVNMHESIFIFFELLTTVNFLECLFWFLIRNIKQLLGRVFGLISWRWSFALVGSRLGCCWFCGSC